MGRLIDADALKRHEQKIATQAWKMQVKASVETILNQFIDDIDHAPTVDAVEVVRCRECRWCNMGECEHKFGLLVSNDENYCSYGEREVDI